MTAVQDLVVSGHEGSNYLIAPGDRYNLTTRDVVGEPKTYLKQVVDKKWSR